MEYCNAEDQALIEEIADTLLPTTAGSPGAKVSRCRTSDQPAADGLRREPAEQKRVVDGLKQFRSTVGDHFASMSQVNRENWLRRIDGEARAAGPNHYFLSYASCRRRRTSSSEIGTTKALRYVMTPGKWCGLCSARAGAARVGVK